MLKKCVNLKLDSNYRRPPYCTKLKVDEPESKGLCRRCMFKDIEKEREIKDEEPQRSTGNIEALERANEYRKARWREYLNFKGPDWKVKLKAAMEAECYYIELAKKYGQMVV